MKRYKLPDGTTHWFAEGDAPACAVPIEPVKKEEPAEVKTKAVEPMNKAITAPKNKAKKGSKK